jgi:hypothetical protein
MYDLNLGILTPKVLASRDDARALLRLLCQSVPELAPEYYGNFEPLTERFNPADLENALKAWKYPFLWKRRRPRSEGSVWMENPNMHTSIYILTQSHSVDLSKLCAFLQASVLLLGADFGYLHLVTEAESASPNAHDMLTPFCPGLTTHELRKHLPNLCWATVFGPPYVELFGRERILSAPASIVEEFAQNTICIQLSESLLDLQSKYDEVNAVRQAVKKHLNCDAFFDPAADSGRKYRVPEFEWKE